MFLSEHFKRNDKRIQPVLIENIDDKSKIVTMDKLHDNCHKEHDCLYTALNNSVQLPRQGAIGIKGSVRLWRLADALQYIPNLKNALGAVEERNRFLERPNADLVRQFVNCLICNIAKFY